MTSQNADCCTPDPRGLLSRLAAGHELSLQAALAPSPEAGDAFALGLDRRTRGLVWLAALLSVGASTATLQWAVERVAATGVDDAAVIAAFETTGAVTGAAQLVANAPRLALALGFDVAD